MLTAEQKVERRKGIGGSDALKIVKGEWYDLWLDKTGRREPKEILGPWDARVRHTMEPLVLDWYEIKFQRPITMRGEVVVCKGLPFLRASLDGYDAAMKKVVDAKALNIWTKEPLQWCIEHYAPQIQHQMICVGCPLGALYVSLGMKEPEIIDFKHDELWADEYIEKCREFWRYVETDTPPPGATGEHLTGFAPTLPAVLRRVDMEGNNAWAAGAADWLKNRKPAKAFDDAAKALKELVAEDVGEAKGHGVVCKRNKAGSLSIKED